MLKDKSLIYLKSWMLREIQALMTARRMPTMLNMDVKLNFRNNMKNILKMQSKIMMTMKMAIEIAR